MKNGAADNETSHLEALEEMKESLEVAVHRHDSAVLEVRAAEGVAQAWREEIETATFVVKEIQEEKEVAISLRARLADLKKQLEEALLAGERKRSAATVTLF